MTDYKNGKKEDLPDFETSMLEFIEKVERQGKVRFKIEDLPVLLREEGHLCAIKGGKYVPKNNDKKA